MCTTDKIFFFPVTKSIEIRWAGNVERMGGEER
jgi:hypothetical protein